MLSFLKSLNKKQRINIPSTINIGNVIIEDLIPLGGMFKPGITKAGRLSLFGKLKDGKKVKVYKSHSKEQINLRLKLGDIRKHEDILFPPIIVSDNKFVVEEWIDGKLFSKLKKNSIDKNSNKVIKFLEEIHFDSQYINLAKNNSNSFCYLSDYLINRLRIWEQWEPVEKLLNAWMKSNEETKRIISSRVSHPDLSLSNMILDSENKIYIIDNELIGVGKGWVLDTRNSFIRSKVKIGNNNQIFERFLELSWKLRLVGSAIDSGDFARAERLSRINIK